MASWADKAIKDLEEGKKVTVTPAGNSMTPVIRNRQQVNLRPLEKGEILKRGMIVLVSMNTRTVYLHKISAVSKDRVQISNNHGHANGWTKKTNVHGIAEL